MRILNKIDIVTSKTNGVPMAYVKLRALIGLVVDAIKLVS